MPDVTSPDPLDRVAEMHERAISCCEAGELAVAALHCREAVALFATIGGEEPANALVEHARLLELLDALTRTVTKNLASLDETRRP